MKTLECINSKISKGTVKVLTASEIKEMVKKGEILTTDDVDVVTCGTCGIMSGTMAVLSVEVSDAGAFTKADSIKFNGVPGTPGPCPNENLGIVDCIVNGTSKSTHDYGGGHLFRDIVCGKTINVEVSSNGKTFSKDVKIDEIAHARMIITRGAFRNYTAFINSAECVYNTIFSVTGMSGQKKEASVSGCGEINPLQNDASMSLKEGTNVLLNGGRGMILGDGTRSTASRRNLSISADMKNMNAEMMDGFVTSAGPECVVSVAAAIPITDERSLRGVCVLDRSIELPIADIQTRTPRDAAHYSDVWEGTDRSVRIDGDRCLHCTYCRPQELCPVNALESASIDRNRCFVCGVCTTTCIGNVFSADLGYIPYGNERIPITLRQSDRNRAERASEQLKTMIEEGKWEIR